MREHWAAHCGVSVVPLLLRAAPPCGAAKGEATALAALAGGGGGKALPLRDHIAAAVAMQALCAYGGGAPPPARAAAAEALLMSPARAPLIPLLALHCAANEPLLDAA